MRAAVTLDPDTESLVCRLMAERGVWFEQALNDAIRAGASDRSADRSNPTWVRSMGVPTVPLDRALQLAGELEDEEIIRRMRAEQ